MKWNGGKASFSLYLMMNSMNLAKVLQIEMNLHDNYYIILSKL